MYEAMARRYRPHTFDDVIGQEHVAQTLKNSIESQRVAHAYLFCGPHGCGKTSMARIFACALVCEHGPTATPCGECAICQDVLRGQDIDVQEIDGASNNGVEQVRALREQVGYVPSRARYKIYIIDEVHMLSVAAFNALLKTLEEPPAHVKFILATTDPHKILGTILSRCQRFDFRLVPPAKMTEYLRRLVASEKAAITDDALAAIAAFSGGSMRDGLVLLDQLVSFSAGSVTREDVERVRGVAGAESVAGIFEAIVSHDLKAALSIVDAVSSRGTNVGDFLDQLIAFGRDLMYVVATGGEDGITVYGPAKTVLLELAVSVTLEQVLLILDVLTQARTRVRSRALTNPLVPLEMAIARLSGLESLIPVKDLVAKLSAYASGAPLPDVVKPAALPLERNTAVTDSAVAVSMQNHTHAESSAVNNEPSITVNSEPLSESVSVENIPVSGYVPKNEEVHFVPAPDNNDLPWRDEVISTGPLSAENEVSVFDTDDDDDDFADELEVTAALARKVVSADQLKSSIDVEAKEERGVPDINLAEVWNKILAVLAEKSRADAPFLGDVYIDKYLPGELYLSVPGGGTFIYEQLEDKHRKQRITESASEILGCEVKIHLVLREALNEADDSSAVPADDFISPAQRMLDAGRERGVKVILDNFEGSIINIEDN